MSRYQKKNIHSLTPILIINHPWSASFIYCDPWHPPCSIYVLTVFLHYLCPNPLWSTSWFGTLHFILHTFLHLSLSFLCSTCPYHHNLFCCSSEITSSNPSLSLNSLLGTLSFTLMPHIHLTILISACATSLSYRPRLTSMQQTTSHISAAQSPSHYQ